MNAAAAFVIIICGLGVEVRRSPNEFFVADVNFPLSPTPDVVFREKSTVIFARKTVEYNFKLLNPRALTSAVPCAPCIAIILNCYHHT